MSTEAEGDNCESGGQRIETGVDSDHDGELSSDEVVKTTYACNGSTGKSGESGESGEPGGDGAPGQTSLVDVEAEAAGVNCTAGGQKISTGLDANGDAVLDSEEVQKVFYVCQGVDGLRSVVSTIAEPAGEHCADAGQKLLHGMDIDRDGTLDADEIEGETYLCNGAVGATGAISLVAVSDEPAGEKCAAGGKRVQTGVDADQSDALEAGEIAQTTYVCNGVEGAASLVLVTKELAGEHCAAGGQRIDQGIDDNGNGTLQPEEFDDTRYVCNGTDGTNGFSTLITVTAITPGATCASGGQALAIGLDNGDGAGTARNGALEEGEIDSTANLCSGEDGEDGEDGKDGEDGVDGAGGVHLIDANGFDLGRMVGSSGFMTNNMTMISTTGYTYSLYYYNLSYYPSTIYFTNNDCTGTAFTYSPVQGGQNAIGGQFASYVDTVGWFASLPSSYATSRSYASYRGNATCYASAGSTNGFTVVSTTAATVGLPATAPATPASLQ